MARKRGRTAGADRRGDAGKEHDLPQGKDGQVSIVRPFKVLLTKPH